MHACRDPVSLVRRTVRFFVAGNNIRSVYESVIFLFAVHPFDVGDVILHNDKDWCA